jgi:hypothetical protein
LAAVRNFVPFWDSGEHLSFKTYPLVSRKEHGNNIQKIFKGTLDAGTNNEIYFVDS